MGLGKSQWGCRKSQWGPFSMGPLQGVEVVPREACAYQGKPRANVEDAQENRGKEEIDADGLTAEILKARSERRSPVNDW